MVIDRRPVPLEPRLGHLLKQAQARLAQASAEALAPHGVDGHDLAVLGVLCGGEELSQVEVAGRLGVDRTTMVALIDGLEDQGLVRRRRSPRDRRKNIVEPTPEGRDCLHRAEQARRAVEHRFLAPLDPETASALVRALTLLAGETSDTPSDISVTSGDAPLPGVRPPSPASPACGYAGERHSETLVLLSLSPRGKPRQGGRHLVRVAEWQTR